MRVNTLTGIRTAFGMGPKISDAVAAQPDGLLRHFGMRQYWRDFESLEKWWRVRAPSHLVAAVPEE